MAAPLDEGGLFPRWPHCDGPVPVVLNACTAPGWRCVYPPHPGVGREMVVCFPTSLIVTKDV